MDLERNKKLKKRKTDQIERCVEVEVYRPGDGTERYYVDGWYTEERISPENGPSEFGFLFSPDYLSYRKIPTSTPIYPPEPKSGYTDQELVEGCKEQTIRIAEAALEYYNKKHHTRYELVDPVGSNSTVDYDGLWFHCNFTAKPEGDLDSFPKLFFAERTKVALDRFAITACRILDGNSTTGCGMCRGVLQHPKSRFRKGLYCPEHRALRPRESYSS